MADVTHDQQHAEHGFLQHHFDTPVQQFDASKLGMWLFLATEILFFSGLFVAYAMYRKYHPEIFEYGHLFLDTSWGAINTVVLLISSFTMAMGVWAVQTSRRKLLIVCLSLTLVGAFGFMGIKAIEYSAKWEHGLLPGPNGYRPAKSYIVNAIMAHEHGDSPVQRPGALAGTQADHAPGAHATDTHGETTGGEAAESGHVPALMEPAEPDQETGMVAAEEDPLGAAEGFKVERSTVTPPAAGPRGMSPGPDPKQVAGKIENLHIFFGIYFAMTGLHGLHVLAGIGVIAWILVGAIQGRYSADYYTPVDLVGLYWHLVDLVWIFLFPLLYLIPNH